MPVRESARAKLNLTLEVLGRRPDGYHELLSLVTFAGVHDVVTLEPGGAPRVAVVGPFAQYIGGENLLVRALSLLREAGPGLALGSVRLQKQIPVAAGLGGGSADAAALLRAVRRANPGAAAAEVNWLGLAERLGADVPVCFLDAPALIGGKGERIVPLASLPAAGAVLVNPRLPLETARVFAALEAEPLAAPRAPPRPPSMATLDELCAYVRARGNHLEAPAARLMPAIPHMKAALERQPGCLLAAMSGSGPTCFGLFADLGSASNAARAIAAAEPEWWVAETSVGGTG